MQHHDETNILLRTVAHTLEIPRKLTKNTTSHTHTLLTKHTTHRQRKQTAFTNYTTDMKTHNMKTHCNITSEAPLTKAQHHTIY